MDRVRARTEDLALIVLSVGGLALFLAPLIAGNVLPPAAALFSALIAMSALVVLAVALQARRLSTRLLVVLAALVAVDATLRLVLVVGLLGFSPIFFLMLVSGFAMGPSFGFAMGSLTLLLSAVLTAGFGPWLPFQMLAAGWVGMGAGYLGRAVGRRTAPTAIGMLALYGGLAGFAFGILLDAWEWPLVLGVASSPIGWAPGLPLADVIRRFAAFYLATSFLWDAFRAVGNVVMVALLGRPVLAALERFRRRFLVEWDGLEPAAPGTVAKMHGDAGSAA